MAEATKKMQMMDQLSKAMAKSKNKTPSKSTGDGFSSLNIKKIKAGASNPASNMTKDYKKYFN